MIQRLVDIVPVPSMEITKTVKLLIIIQMELMIASDKVVYTITVNNTGDTSLTGVTMK